MSGQVQIASKNINSQKTKKSELSQAESQKPNSRPSGPRIAALQIELKVWGFWVSWDTNTKLEEELASFTWCKKDLKSTIPFCSSLISFSHTVLSNLFNNGYQTCMLASANTNDHRRFLASMAVASAPLRPHPAVSRSCRVTATWWELSPDLWLVIKRNAARQWNDPVTGTQSQYYHSCVQCRFVWYS